VATTHGNDGIVKIGANTVAEVRSFTYSETVDLAEDSSMGDTSKSYKAGLTDGSGSVSCWWDETDTNGQESMTIGASVELHLMPEGATAGDTEYTGTVVISGIDYSIDKGSIVERGFRFQGILTEATV